MSFFKSRGGGKRKRAGSSGSGDEDEDVVSSQKEDGEESGSEGEDAAGVPGGAAMFVKSFAASCRQKRTDLFNTDDGLPLPGNISAQVHALTSHKKADQCQKYYADAYAADDQADMVSYRPDNKCYQYQKEGGYWMPLVDSAAFCLMGNALAPTVTRGCQLIRKWAGLSKVGRSRVLRLCISFFLFSSSHVTFRRRWARLRKCGKNCCARPSN
jgi:hypothetical protein